MCRQYLVQGWTGYPLSGRIHETFKGVPKYNFEGSYLATDSQRGPGSNPKGSLDRSLGTSHNLREDPRGFPNRGPAP